MEPLVEITRSNRTECVHYGYVCVTDSSNNVIHNIGDPDRQVYLRSTAKPFQAIPLVYSGAMEKFKITIEELAIVCASHSGQDYHLRTVLSILDKIGLNESNLGCGAAMPYNQQAKEELYLRHERPNQLYNGCSGKHAGMLAVCKFYGYPVEGYYKPEHPLQRHINEILAELLGCGSHEIPYGLDGCGIPTFLTTMKQASYLFSLLAAGSSGTGKYRDSLELIKNAMLAHPEMVSGDNEFCTELISATKGRVIGKVGAEGMYCIAIPEKKLGVCIKVTDGRERALYPAAVHALKQLGILNNEMQDKLGRWNFYTLKNHKGELTGHAIPVFNILKN